jgi:DNA-binding PadR family transcriptional regulator
MGETELLILVNVAKEGTTYAVPLFNLLNAKRMGVSYGRLHAALEWLERNDYIRSQIEEGGPERGYRRKRIVYLSGKGRRYLDGNAE